MQPAATEVERLALLVVDSPRTAAEAIAGLN
jgi:hypothetical protein